MLCEYLFNLTLVASLSSVFWKTTNGIQILSISFEFREFNDRFTEQEIKIISINCPVKKKEHLLLSPVPYGGGGGGQRLGDMYFKNGYFHESFLHKSTFARSLCKVISYFNHFEAFVLVKTF